MSEDQPAQGDEKKPRKPTRKTPPTPLDPAENKCIMCETPFYAGDTQLQLDNGLPGGARLKPICHHCYHTEVASRRAAAKAAAESTI